MAPQQLSIDIEDLNSWPQKVLDLIQESKDLFSAYHSRAKEIDRLCQGDIVLRMRPPSNEYGSAFRKLVMQLEPYLEAANIVVFHCTRLTEYEAQEISTDGLKMLTPSLVFSRLDKAFKHGLLNDEEHKYLASSEQIAVKLRNDWGQRTGLLFFCSTRSILSDEGGVHRLFRSWGGEAIYAGHEEDNRISGRLHQIGKPYIVRCSVPYAETNHAAYSLPEILISFFVSNEIPYPEPSFKFDVWMKRGLSSREVLGLISIDDPEFEKLTGYKNWGKSCQI